MEEISYQQKFIALDEWLDQIVDTIKKDLKNEHLKNDWQFVKKYFNGKNINKLTLEELTQGYRDALSQEEKAEEIAEFMANRWLFKNSELYQFFEVQLSQINPNFQEIKEIEEKKGKKIIDEANSQFNPIRTYLFTIINSVAFSPVAIKELAQQAKDEASNCEREAEEEETRSASESIESFYEQKIARLTDKYEKKLIGLQKKYSIDLEGLKKQVASLQRKLKDS